MISKKAMKEVGFRRVSHPRPVLVTGKRKAKMFEVNKEVWLLTTL
jgi:hypothetical protein